MAISASITVHAKGWSLATAAPQAPSPGAKRPWEIGDFIIVRDHDADGSLPLQSHKSFRTKQKLAKAKKQNRPIPQWIRLRTDNTIRYDLNPARDPHIPRAFVASVMAMGHLHMRSRASTGAPWTFENFWLTGLLSQLQRQAEALAQDPSRHLDALPHDATASCCSSSPSLKTSSRYRLPAVTTRDGRMK